jgi:hypothetical protein
MTTILFFIKNCLVKEFHIYGSFHASPDKCKQNTAPKKTRLFKTNLPRRHGWHGENHEEIRQTGVLNDRFMYTA